MTPLLTLFISHAETKSIKILLFKRKPIERTPWLVWLSVFYFCFLFLFFTFVLVFVCFFFLHDTYINYIKVPFTGLSTYIALHYLLTVLLRWDLT